MTVDRDLEDAIIAESKLQREVWAKLMPGCPMPRKPKEK